MMHNHTISDDKRLQAAIQGGVKGQNTDGNDENQQTSAAAAPTDDIVEVPPPYAECVGPTAIESANEEQGRIVHAVMVHAVRVEDPRDDERSRNKLHNQKRVWFVVVAVLGTFGGVTVVTLVALIFIFPGAPTSSVPSAMPSLSHDLLQQGSALVAFYDAMNGNEWDNSTNWLSDAPVCQWYGIDCNNNDEVIEIDMYSNNLQGSIPSEMRWLSNLERLDLPRNSLTGSIPSELGLLS
eukprot:CAMPEP_0196801142 /NCGR_PEP_ID=MMETSP1362-20130617/830_1 /TAXON_ID=163516 /ORGANISM="Leptocylindrus danicus, Strain CCMP1856" /LENGTH=237 /DNA_ID=CAMNT_0042171911 /DNA_START=91 /DNA_END=801 /DNA_ORIENTATION=-